jgi:predicted RNA binding protein YcfA (HicA-like mRNA interferase family)
MPNWNDLEKYLKRHGWELVRQNGRDKMYRKILPDGTSIRTAVSKSSGEISKGMFAKILKQQLGITKEEFNS